MRTAFAATALLAVGLLIPPFSTAEEKVSPNFEKHRILEDLDVGARKIEGTDGGKKVTGMIVGEWALTKYCVVFSGYAQTDGTDGKLYLNGIIGWDCETNKIKEHIFFSDGGNATASYEVRGRQLVGERNGVTGDGTRYSQKLSFMIEKDKWVGAPTKSVDSNGKTLAEYGHYVFTKVK